MNGRSEAATLPAEVAGATSRAVPWRTCAVASSTGVLIAAAFLDPRFYPITWVSFVPLLWTVQRAQSNREAAWAGFAAGFATNFIGYYWLIYTMTVFGGFPVPVSVFFYLCLTAYSSMQFVLFALFLRRVGFAWLGAAPAVAWAALEFLYPSLFQWRMANSQFHLPVLIQIGDVTGPFALSLALVWFSVGLVLLLGTPRRLAPLAGATALVAIIAIYGAVRLPQIEAAMAEAPSLRVALVQGNISVEKKGNAAYFEVNVDTYRKLTAEVQESVDLVIWPETVAQWWTPADATRLEPKQHPFPGLRRPLVYGGPAYRYRDDGEAEAFNSAFLIAPEDKVLARYDKQILMPFGEYLPGSSLLPFIKQISPNSGDYTAGRTNNTFTVPGAVLGPLICYEDVVIGIPREMTRAGAQILFNILNDAWFGDTAGPHEHLQLALWRAVENRRYLLRSSNSGVTSVVDPVGRVVATLPTFREDVLVASVQPLSLLSFYTRWGDVFGWTLVLLSLAVLTWKSRA